MVFLDWLRHNTIGLLEAAAIAAGPVFAGFAILLDARARRVGNLIHLTKEHRDLWERMFSDPDLKRILDPNANVIHKPVSPEEEMFVVFLILHMNSSYYAIRASFFPRPKGLRGDVESFFSLPIPRAVWDKVKGVQDMKFVKFVERCFPPIDLATE